MKILSQGKRVSTPGDKKTLDSLMCAVLGSLSASSTVKNYSPSKVPFQSPAKDKISGEIQIYQLTTATTNFLLM